MAVTPAEVAEVDAAFETKRSEHMKSLLAKQDYAAAKKFAVLRAKPVINKALSKYPPLTFEDVLPALETLDTIDEVQTAVSDPGSYFEKLLTSFFFSTRR